MADQNLRIFFVDIGEDGLAVHVVDLPLGDLLDDGQLPQGQVVLELPVEDLHLLEADVHVVRMVHHDVVVLLGIDFQQGVSEDFVRALDVAE